MAGAVFQDKGFQSDKKLYTVFLPFFCIAAVSLYFRLVSDEIGWLMEPGNLQQLNDVFLKAISVNSEELLQKKKKVYELIKSRYRWEKVAEINLAAIHYILSQGH